MDLQATPEVARSPVTFRDQRGRGYWSVLLVMMAAVFVGLVWVRSIPIWWAALGIPVVIFMAAVSEWRKYRGNYVRVHDWGIEVGDWVSPAGIFGLLTNLFVPSWSKKIEYSKIRSDLLPDSGFVQVGYAGPDSRSYRQHATLPASDKNALVSEMMSRFDFKALQPVDKF